MTRDNMGLLAGHSAPGNALLSARSELGQSAEFVHQAQLMDGPARRFQEFRAGDYDRQALSARQGDVEPVRAEQELDVAGQAFSIRGRHRNKNDRRFLALELIDRPDSGSSRQDRFQVVHLNVVRAYDEDVLRRHRSG